MIPLRDNGALAQAGVAFSDGLQQQPGDGRRELWHFDGRLDDGTSIGIAFCLVGTDPDDPERYRTVVNVMFTDDDGDNVVHFTAGTVRADTVSFDQCDLVFGTNHVRGDLSTYDLHVESDDGSLVIDLHYTALTQPWRPGGTGGITLDDNTHFADLIIARCAITGTLTRNGSPTAVTGEGYHDHQWFDTDPMATWHHWLLAHLYTDDATVIVYDLVANAAHGHVRTTWLGVFGRDGSLLHDGHDRVASSAETVTDDSSGKEYPKRIAYTGNDPADEIVVSLDWAQTLVNEDLYAAASQNGGPDTELGGASRAEYDRKGIQPTYARYVARGAVQLVQLVHDHGIIDGVGEAICELNYPGKEPASW